jgi:hypothetical protein
LRIIRRDELIAELESLSNLEQRKKALEEELRLIDETMSSSYDRRDEERIRVARTVTVGNLEDQELIRRGFKAHSVLVGGVKSDGTDLRSAVRFMGKRLCMKRTRIVEDWTGEEKVNELDEARLDPTGFVDHTVYKMPDNMYWIHIAKHHPRKDEPIELYYFWGSYPYEWMGHDNAPPDLMVHPGSSWLGELLDTEALDFRLPGLLAWVRKSGNLGSQYYPRRDDDEGGVAHERTPSDGRSDSLNPNNPSHDASEQNRANQLNPDHEAYHRSRGRK